MILEWSCLLVSLIPSLDYDFCKRSNETVKSMRKRVAEEITTTFASSYTHEVTLEEALQLESIKAYGKQATGEKYLITPQG